MVGCYGTLDELTRCYTSYYTMNYMEETSWKELQEEEHKNFLEQTDYVTNLCISSAIKVSPVNFDIELLPCRLMLYLYIWCSTFNHYLCQPRLDMNLQHVITCNQWQHKKLVLPVFCSRFLTFDRFLPTDHSSLYSLTSTVLIYCVPRLVISCFYFSSVFNSMIQIIIRNRSYVKIC